MEGEILSWTFEL